MAYGVPWGGGLLGLAGNVGPGSGSGMGILDLAGTGRRGINREAIGDTLLGLGSGLLAYGSGQPNWAQTAMTAMRDNRITRGEQRRIQEQEQRDRMLFDMRMSDAERTKNQTAERNARFQNLIPTLPENLRRTAEAMGPDFLDVWGQQQVKQAFPDPLKNPAGVQEYEYAKSQGFTGTLLDWEKEKAAAGRAPEQPPQAPEKVRLAQAAGLTPGTPEYNAFLLGDGSGMDLGNSFDAKAMQFLLTGDPASPEYAAVYNQMAQPRVTFDPATGKAVSITPNMSAYRAPSYTGAPAPAGAAAPGATPQRFSDAGYAGGQAPAPQPAPQAQGNTGGVTVTQVADPALDKTAMAKLNNSRAAATTLVAALNDYKQAFKTAGTGDRFQSALGLSTDLNTKYNAAALLAKGEELFNLGVLNGPDLEIIRRTIPDPSTFSSLALGDADKQIDTIINLISTRLNEQERLANQPATTLGPSKPTSKADYDALPSGATFIAPDGSKRKKP